MDRVQMRRLDICLHELEDAHECGGHVVTPHLASKVQPFLPSVIGAVPIAAALDRGFAEQAMHLERVGQGAPDEVEAAFVVKPEQNAGLQTVAIATGDGDDAASARRHRSYDRGGAIDEAAARELTERIRS